MSAGVIGAIAGSCIGILGGLFGTYCAIRNIRGLQARAFAVKAAVGWWIGVSVFVALVWVLPHPQRHFMWIPYAVLLPLGIYFTNRGLARAREPEGDLGS